MTCRRTVDLEGDELPEGARHVVVDPRDRPALDRWCRAVGPVVFRSSPREGSGPESLDARGESGGTQGFLALVVWNVRVGGGDLPGLIEALRAGRLTGGARPLGTVVLVQEAYRAGRGVPARIPEGGVATGRIADEPPVGARIDVVAVARETGMSLLYAPSMRNGGEGGEGRPAEDRGNAILANLPLEHPLIVELPFERQRRVVVSATVRWPPGGQASRTLRLSSVHLDNRAPWRRMWRTFGAARGRQALGLRDALARTGPEPEVEVVGGDLNTWFGQQGESAFRILREALPHPAVLDGRPTHHWELGLDRQSDYLMGRLPGGWDLTVRRLDEEYGSDHFPLIGLLAAPGSG